MAALTLFAGVVCLQTLATRVAGEESRLGHRAYAVPHDGGTAARI